MSAPETPESLHAALVALQRKLRPLLGPVANANVELVLAEVATGVPARAMREFVRRMEEPDRRDPEPVGCGGYDDGPEPVRTEWTPEDAQAHAAERTRRATAKRRYAELKATPGNVRNEAGFASAPSGLPLTEYALLLFNELVRAAKDRTQVRASEAPLHARDELTRAGLLRTERVRGEQFYFLTDPAARKLT